MTLTLESLQTTLAERFGGVLKSGCHDDQCAVCVRELRAAMLELPWSDHPDGDISSPTDIVCQRLNDAAWSSDAVRTRYCLPLALLSEATAVKGWRDTYILQTIRITVAGAFRAAASVQPTKEHQDSLNEHAEKLAAVEGADADVAAYAAAADAAYAAAAAAAKSAAKSAKSAAWSAAWSAKSAAWSVAWSAAWSAESAESAAWSAESAAWSAESAQDKALIEAVGIFIAAQGNPEAQAAWDALMAEDAQRAADAAKEE